MNIYLPPNGAVEDLVNTLEQLRPGMVSSRLMLEVSTEDKGLAMLLKKLADDIPDEMNAYGHKPAKIVKRGRAVRTTEKAVPADELTE